MGGEPGPFSQVGLRRNSELAMVGVWGGGGTSEVEGIDWEAAGPEVRVIREDPDE